MPPRRLLSLLLFISLLLPFPVHGQANLGLSRLTVSFWPEYDQPAVLVIYQAELPGDAVLPATIELPLPAGVAAPHAVAFATEDSGLVNAEYDLLDGAEGQIVQIEAMSGAVWLEYYQDLAINDPSRSFSYSWPGTMSVAEFNFEVQQPLGADSLNIEPAPQGQQIGADGLTYLTGSFGAVAQGEQVELQLSYQKTNDDLTAPQLSLAPDQGVSLDPPVSQGLANWVLPALAGLGLALLVAGAFFLWQSRKTSQPKKRRRRSRSKKSESEARFCSQCGQPVGIQDKFCRNCGAEQRPR